ncbi:Exodeoxyribonuclease VII large subunit [Rubellimicrobium mesophilum DSM 19309]|uniref:Exodeoxyribonuclease 7 large subunit n=1 Tax=Rubellimicrobium mesophilum DSM 19309 TaxID=442562 RepID=A0A017HT39_9RHOB|nr:exodeoxyribonuclease VII large subunit [Rubellimicrobium mesophilum]EYD77657.1 Exodeoxyribonuclease VII large subunit [Rubellimicrobium mesophilum DSM 19309]
MDLLDDDDAPPRRSNAPEFSVSEISGAVKRMVEGEFAFVRVRGEIGRVSRPPSGHIYFDLKDGNAVLAAVSWKGQAARLTARPEEGLEMVAVGRLTTFPGQSKYQMIVDDLVPAGAGALMAQLEARRKKLAGEGLFDPARKKPIPYLPEVIGVVTSPSGAVIRDILHRLRDRFPRRVIVWPVAVQGQNCAPEVSRAVMGFNALPEGGPIPRPDLLIVARGGGSIEDLWGFNEEIVVRAVAGSRIPVISAVGHETDTTLCDFAADLRAPTPTAAAEMAVPVRAELVERVATLGARGSRALRLGVDRRRQRLGDLARALPRGDAILAGVQQRVDFLSARLPAALRGVTSRQRVKLADLRIGTGVLQRSLQDGKRRVAEAERSLGPALARVARDAGRELQDLSGRLELARDRRVAGAGEALARLGPRLDPLAARAAAEGREDFARVARRFTAELPLGRIGRLRDALAALDRLNESLSYKSALERGFAVVRSEGQVVTRAEAAARAASLEIEFADGRVMVGNRPAAPKKPGAEPPPEQGSLL